MNRFQKAFLGTVGGIVLLDIAASTGVSYYDSQTRQQLLRVVSLELPPRASPSQIEEFLRRHTTGFSFDEYHQEYVGFIGQRRIDKELFDRKVQLVLRVDSDRALVEADIRVFYTFL